MLSCCSILIGGDGGIALVLGVIFFWCILLTEKIFVVCWGVIMVLK